MKRLLVIVFISTAIMSKAQIGDELQSSKYKEEVFIYHVDSVYEIKEGDFIYSSFKKRLQNDEYTPILPNNLPDGIWIIYFENGQIALKVNIHDLSRNGLLERYWSNSKLRDRKNYSADKLNGEIVHFTYDGILQWRSFYFNDEEHLTITYYKNGQMELMQKYHDGKATPTVLYWDEKGNPLTPKQFLNYKIR